MADLRRLAVLALLAACAPASLACSCMPRGPQEMLQNHGLIFSGTVTEVDQGAGKATFRVHKLYKGEVAGDRVTIAFNNSSGASCGIGFSAGQSHTVFAGRWSGRQDGLYSTGLCSMIPYQSAPLRYQPALDAYVLQVAAARKKVAADPRSRPAREDLLKVYESAADHVAALRELEALRGIAPADAAIPARMGETHLKLEQPAEALKAFDAALALNTGLEAAKRGRDQALAKLGRVADMDGARRSYAGMVLAKADFSGRDLSGANFSKAQLDGARFDRAKLGGADFREMESHSGSFAEASLAGARFDGVRTYQVNFSGAELKDASFAGANVFYARFTRADLRGANLTGMEAEEANFSGARMQGVKFAGAHLYHADLSGVDLSGADLRGLELQGAVLRGAKLVGANLGGAYLAGPLGASRAGEGPHEPGRAADLRGADLTKANLDGADLRYALFDCKTRWPAGFDPLALPLLPITSASPGPPAKTALFAQPGTLRETPGRSPAREGTKLRGPELLHVDLAGADLSGAKLSGFAFRVADLSRARLRGTDLRYGDLQSSNLSGADLSGADLSGAMLWGTDFSGAKLAGANLTGARFNERTKWPAGFDPAAAGARSGL